MPSYLAPRSIAETIMTKIGVSKCKLSFWQVVVMGFLAGAFIAFGAMLATRMGAMITFDKGIAALISGVVFSVGLMLVVIAGGELFTGNNLMFMSVLSGDAKLKDMLLKWVIVFFSNFLGAIFLAWLMYRSGLLTGVVEENAVAIAAGKIELAFFPALIRGILCNWLVCLAVWMALASQDVTGKIVGMLFPVMMFVAAGFEHSVANMYFIPLGIMLDPTSISWAGFVNNLIPVTIGNIIGGAFFVATAYWFVFRKCVIAK